VLPCNEAKGFLRNDLGKLAQILSTSSSILARSQHLVTCARLNEVPLLVVQHVGNGLDKTVQVTHAIEEVRLDVVVARFRPRGDPAPEVAILPDKAPGPLLPYRHIGPVQVQQDRLLVAELLAKICPQPVMLRLGLRKHN
jgi:hypothetical protein